MNKKEAAAKADELIELLRACNKQEFFESRTADQLAEIQYQTGLAVANAQRRMNELSRESEHQLDDLIRRSFND